MKFLIAAIGAVLLGLGVRISANAQGVEFPARPVRIVVALAAGGPADTLARIIGPKLSESWSQPVIVENRPGASGVIAAEHVLRSPADGYSLLLTITTHIQAIGLKRKLPYDPLNDFAAVTQLALAPLVLTVRSDGPRSVAEFIQKARSDPNSVSYSSPGNATTGYIYAEQMNRAVGIKAVNVPFSGGAPALQALLGNQVTASFLEVTQVSSQSRGGRLRPLAIAGFRRATTLSEVPTFAELGIPGFEVVGWHGVLARGTAPKEIIEKISADIRAVLRDPQVVTRFRDLGLEVVGNTPADFAGVLRADAVTWAKLISESGITAD